MARNRTWYTDMNVAFPDTSSTTLTPKSWLWLFKSILKGVSTGTNGTEGAPPSGAHWTVTGSSDSSTAAFDGTDRWTDSFDGTKIVLGAAHTNAHSWICLRNSGSTRWILLSYVGSTANFASIYYATSAFSGGSTTSRPTSTTEWRLVEGGGAGDSKQMTDGLAVPYKMHMTRDANGEFYMFVSKNSSALAQNVLGFVSLLSARAADTVPHISLYSYLVGGTVVVSGGATQLGGGSRTATNAAAEGVQFSTPVFSEAGTGGAITPPFLNVDGTLDLFEITICKYSGGALTSVKGVLPDAHWAGAVGNGSMVPSTSPYERCLIGNLFLPFSVAPSL